VRVWHFEKDIWIFTESFSNVARELIVVVFFPTWQERKV
jgi:hypothetical protein